LTGAAGHEKLRLAQPREGGDSLSENFSLVSMIIVLVLSLVFLAEQITKYH
jgi:hypothetical protein